MLNNKQKAVIHIAKAQVGMTDEEYRAMLSSFGVESSNFLDDRSFQIVMQHFEKMGFKSRFVQRTKPASSKSRLMAKINVIKNELGLMDGYLDAMSRRMFGVAAYKWLPEVQLHKLVIALSYHQRRQEKKTCSK